MILLSNKEEEIMLILWEIEKGFIHDIVNIIPKPKPAYNTVSTIVRILEKKGFVGYSKYGNTHEYFPKITKAEFKHFIITNLIKKYFDGSSQDTLVYINEFIKM